MSGSSFAKRVGCPACAGARWRTVYSCRYDRAPLRDYISAHFDRRGQVTWQGLEGAEYRVERCLDCGLCFQREVPTDELVREVYDHWVAPDEVGEGFGDERLDAFLRGEWGGTFDCQHTHPRWSWAAHEMHHIADLLQRPPNRLRVLDFGMGWSTWARAVRGMGCEVIGHEKSEKCAAFAERLGFEMVGYDELGEQRFDFINTEQVFEHLVDPYTVLRHLRGAVRPGGIIKISAPRAWRVASRLSGVDVSRARADRGAFFPLEPVIHLQCFSPGSVAALADRVGLEVMPASTTVGYGFVRRGGLRWTDPPHAIKSLLRPLHRVAARRNLYALLRAPS